MTNIIVKDTKINIAKINDEDYICITDMLKAKDGDFFVTDWLRNRNTLEYIGLGKVYIILNSILVSFLKLRTNQV